MDEQLPEISGGFGTELWDEEQVLGRRIKRQPQRKLDREQQAKDIVEVFHAIGGVPRLAHWAHEHPGFFFTKLFPKVLPNQTNVEHSGSISVVYHAAIPPSPLDGEFTDVTPQNALIALPPNAPLGPPSGIRPEFSRSELDSGSDEG